MPSEALTILIVDDEPEVCELLYHWLTSEGYECVTASSAEMALKLLEDNQFHLVLSDIMMPGMSGLDLLGLVRSGYPDVAVIMATAVDDRKTAIMTLQLGAYGFVIKPFDKNEILINVANALERRRLVLRSEEYKRALEDKIRIIDDLYEHILQAGKAKAIADHTAEVAHQLRQPLAIIGGFARRIAKEASSGENLDASAVEESSRIMVSEVHRLEQILGGLIDFTHREGVRLEAVNPNEMIKYILDINRPKLEEKNLRVDTSLGSEVDEIPLDPDRLQHVVRNLIANAIEASPVGGPVRIETGVTIPSEKARHSGELDSYAYFEMKIHNLGKAIPPEDMERIFDPFFTTKSYGTGIGLTLARKIIEDHRGSLSLKSDKDGTVATVWLPVSQAANTVTPSLQ
ncbi:MAG: response regulator [Candidatus Marsarchaeota archaeon]|nr:response regulator [Candidatus Marsarchaeota archaeon]